MVMVKVEYWEDGMADASTVMLPGHWEICDNCRGEGASSAHLGAIPAEEWHQWDRDDQENYLSGMYDQTCECCKGSGKIGVVNPDACSPEQKRILALAEEWERGRAETAAEHAAERRMGA